MPTDAYGRFHPNTQMAMVAERSAPPKEHERGNPERPKEDGGGEHEIGHELMTRAHEAEPGKHMHIKADGMGGHVTHHVGEDGVVEGPHHHEDPEALHSHIDQFFNEEQAEPENQERAAHGFGKMAHLAELSGI